MAFVRHEISLMLFKIIPGGLNCELFFLQKRREKFLMTSPLLIMLLRCAVCLLKRLRLWLERSLISQIKSEITFFSLLLDTIYSPSKINYGRFLRARETMHPHQGRRSSSNSCSAAYEDSSLGGCPRRRRSRRRGGYCLTIL